jgi:HD-GYP domain-containing protein (c-di-GMP phosphodiesterase class II)
LSVALARELGLSQREQNALRTASQLHRVGSIAIPLTLLNKPELSPVELALVRTHVDESHKILAEIEFDAPIAEIVFQHQERLDGSGFPRGLRGDQISVEARVLAVADAVVAAAGKQASAVSTDALLNEIEAGADRLFDARVTQACSKLFREQGFALPA